MRETLLGQRLRDGSSVRRARIRLEKIAAGGIGGLIRPSRRSRFPRQTNESKRGEKRGSGSAAQEGSVTGGGVTSNPPPPRKGCDPGLGHGAGAAILFGSRPSAVTVAVLSSQTKDHSSELPSPF